MALPSEAPISLSSRVTAAEQEARTNDIYNETTTTMDDDGGDDDADE